MRILDSTYNSNSYTLPCIRPKIIHYAAVKDYQEDWAYKKYEAVEFVKGAEADE